MLTLFRRDVEKGGQAIFEYRKQSAADKDTRYRQPMMYATYAWADLPEPVRVHYRTCFVHGATAVGIKVDVSQ